jgi:hypothetical protein
MSRMGLSFDDAHRGLRDVNAGILRPTSVRLAFLGGSPRLSGCEEGRCSDDVDGRFAEMRVQGSFQASEIVGAVMEDTCLVKAFHGSSAQKVVVHIFAKDGGAEEHPFRL